MNDGGLIFDWINRGTNFPKHAVYTDVPVMLRLLNAGILQVPQSVPHADCGTSGFKSYFNTASGSGSPAGNATRATFNVIDTVA